MPITIICTKGSCNTELKCPDDAAGSSVNCPSCRTENSVPKDAAVTMGVLGGYELQGRIGEGGMGVVYEAIQTNLGRKVALKVLSHKFSGDEVFLGRFQREARSAAALNHPNVVQVFDIGQEGVCHFFSMEFVEGETVLDRMKREEKIPLNEALQIVECVAEALSDASKDSIIHRDIKPENIMLSTKGRIKLADLGLAKNVEEEDQSMTQTGTSLGTPYYMSPEQARDAASVDHRSDIYSLGITFLHMLTGKRPFFGKTAYAIILAHNEERLPTGSDLGTYLPPEVDTLIQKMAAKRADDRFQTYGELLSEIKRLNPGSGQTSVRPAPSFTGKFQEDMKTGQQELQQAATVAGIESVSAPPGGRTESNLRDAMTMAAPPPPKQPPKALIGGIAVAASMAIAFILLTSRPRNELGNGDLQITRPPDKEQNDDPQALSQPSNTPALQPSNTPGTPVAQPVNPAEDDNPLPRALTKTFEVPDEDFDNHNHPVRKGVDETTGYPLEVRHIKTRGHYVFIPAGKFAMGTPPEETHRLDDETLHPVTLTRPLYMAKYETTVGEFKMHALEAGPVTQAEKKQGAIVWDDGWKNRPDASWRNPYFEQTLNHPALALGQKDTIQFIMHLNQKAPAGWMPPGKGVFRFSTPTEAQWEYACRAGTTTAFYWGDAAARAGEYANVADKSFVQQMTAAKEKLNYPTFEAEDGHAFTTAVGSFKPNMWGFHDMLGNVREWCADGMHPIDGPVTDPLGDGSKAAICLRGGSFLDGPELTRSGARHQEARYLPNVSAGFRLAFRLTPDANADLAEKFKHLFEVPAEVKDQHGNPIRKGKDTTTGLPLEVRCRQTGMHLILVPAGKFTMGSPEDEWHRGQLDVQHEVTLTLPFYLGKYEVTVGEFASVFEGRYLAHSEQQERIPTIWKHGKWQAQPANWQDPCYEQSDAHPVCLVSWSDSQNYVSWLNITAPYSPKNEELQFALPTEAEWEYACRAGTTSRFYWGNDETAAGEYGNVYDETFLELFKHEALQPLKTNDRQITAAPVGSYKPNTWGLHDMIGNVSELCQDKYGAYPIAATDPVGGADASGYNHRGGSWGTGLQKVRCGSRSYLYQYGPPFSVLNGFRTVFRLPRDRAVADRAKPAREIVPNWSEGCVLAYSFNSGTVTSENGRATNVTDLSASKHHGKVLGGMMIQGHQGHALLFDGSKHGVECPESEALKCDKEFSVALWLKAEKQTVSWNRLVHQFHFNGKAGWAVNINGADFEGGMKDGVDLEFFDMEAKLHGAFGKPVVTDGAWHFVVSTFDGSAARIYLNGQMVGEKNLPEPTSIKPAPGTIMIGIGDNDETVRGLRGVIDEVAIWQRSLNPNEVRDMFDYSKSGRSYCETLGDQPAAN